MFNVGIVAANYNRLFLQLKIVDTLKLGNKYRLWMHITFFRRQPESLYHTTHTDPVCEFFSKIYLMAKLLQKNSNLNDLEYSRHMKVRKIEKKAKKIFEGQTKARGKKTQIFTIFWTF